MKKAFLSIATVFAAALALTGVTYAATAGQIEGGDIYRVRNVTTNSDFSDPASGTCSNTFQFKVRVHNPGPDPLTNVNVKATLPTAEATSHSSQVTITADNANPKTTTDTAGVKLDKAGTLTYVAGSTELLDANGSKLSTLGDGIFTSGVNIGNVGVSVQQKRFVQFSVKVSCKEAPTPTPVTPVTPTKPETPAKTTTTTTTTTPAELPQTGSAQVIASILGLGALAASIVYYIASRRAKLDRL